MRRTPLIVTLTVIALMLIGGGMYFFSQQQSTQAPSTMPGMGQQGQAQTPEPASVNAVAIQNFAFSPADITIKKGATVKWTNNDAATHTVTESDNKNGPNSPPLAKDQTYSFTFNEAGIFTYTCTVHPSMVGTVTVMQ